MNNAELEEVICGLHRRIALTTAGTPLQDDLIKAVGALRIAVNRIAELEAQLPKDGEWIPNSPFTGNCSECGGNGNLKDKYCSNCGAKMDEKENANV